MNEPIKKFRDILSMHIPWPYILSLIIIIIVLFIVYYNKIENFYVFFPRTDIAITPDDLNLNYKNVYFHSKDGENLHGWFFSSGKDSPVILYCHGNACNISHILEYAVLLMEKDMQVFIFDYRGYGNSTGSPSEKGIYMDTQAAYDYLIEEEKIASDRIVLVGHSVGAAAAIEVATKNKVRSVIIESAFTSTKDMSRKIFPMNLITFLLPANYNNLEKVAKIKAPKLFIHGREDEIVPFEMGEKLFKTSVEPKFIYPVEGAGHNDTYVVGGERYFQVLADFVYFSGTDSYQDFVIRPFPMCFDEEPSSLLR